MTNDLLQRIFASPRRPPPARLLFSALSRLCARLCASPLSLFFYYFRSAIEPAAQVLVGLNILSGPEIKPFSLCKWPAREEINFIFIYKPPARGYPISPGVDGGILQKSRGGLHF